MIGQIIQSYLVSLGVQIDKPGFQQADATIRQTGENVDRVTAGMAKNFVKASTLISSAIASVTASAMGLMKAAASEDLAMQKYARTMMMTEGAAWQMKKATDALGESINDIALTPELLSRYKQLTADGSQMMVGGDFKETMKSFRDLMFEFTRLKQEASYALNWVGYYLMKYLQRPLADIREKFKSFNDMVIKNMSVWTEKVARAIFYVIEIGRHLLEFIVDIGKHLKSLWDSFPTGVKKAIVAITALNAVLSAGPLGRAIMLISTLLLLIDDYYGYMEGKDALLGKYWDKLNNFLDTAKQKYEELKAIVAPYWDRLVGYVQQAKQWFDALLKSINEWGSSTGTEMLNTFIDECNEWWQILSDLYDVIENSVKVTWKTFMEELEKNDTINDVRQMLEKFWRVLVLVYQAVKNVINGIIRLIDEITKTAEWQEFIAVVADLVDGILELYDAINELLMVALEGLFGEFRKTDTVRSFRDVLRAVLKVLTGIIRAINWVVRGLKKLFDIVAKNKTFIKFWHEVGNAINGALEKLGKFGRAMVAFLSGDWKKAAKILSGGSGGNESGQGDTDWNKRVVYERFKAAGYSDEAIAGIMGRVQQEHNFDTSNVPEYDDPETGLHLGGYGMFQWNGGRTTDFLEWARSNGLNPQDPGAQADYAIIEAQDRGITPERMNSKSVSEAATIWTDEWEVGKHGNEQQFADEIYADIKNGAPWMSAEYSTPPQSVTPDNVQEAVTSDDDGQRIGYSGGASITAANSELQLRFSDAVAAMRKNGYDFYIQSASDNSIGFTSPADDIDNIMDVLKSYGLSVSHDDNGFYVSLDPERSNPSYDSYIQNVSFAPSNTRGFSLSDIIKPLRTAKTNITDMIQPLAFAAQDKRQVPVSAPMPTNLDELEQIVDMLRRFGAATSRSITGMSDIMKPMESVRSTMDGLMAKGKSYYDKMREQLGGGLAANQYPYMAMSGAGGGPVTINNSVTVGDVNVNGNNLTNGDAGRIVAQKTVEAQADFFMKNMMATSNQRPTEAAIKAGRV